MDDTGAFLFVVGRGVHPDHLFAQTTRGKFGDAWVIFCRQGDDIMCVSQTRDPAIAAQWMARHKTLFDKCDEQHTEIT